jgi:hypothetical protein
MNVIMLLYTPTALLTIRSKIGVGKTPLRKEAHRFAMEYAILD